MPSESRYSAWRLCKIAFWIVIFTVLTVVVFDSKVMMWGIIVLGFLMPFLLSILSVWRVRQLRRMATEYGFEYESKPAQTLGTTLRLGSVLAQGQNVLAYRNQIRGRWAERDFCSMDYQYSRRGDESTYNQTFIALPIQKSECISFALLQTEMPSNIVAAARKVISTCYVDQLPSGCQLAVEMWHKHDVVMPSEVLRLYSLAQEWRMNVEYVDGLLLVYVYESWIFSTSYMQILGIAVMLAGVLEGQQMPPPLSQVSVH